VSAPNLDRGVEYLGTHPYEVLEFAMAGKNKGGREVRKPKQPKKPKTDELTTIVAKVAGGTKRPK
jgi:hypothetical protein